MLVLLKFVAAVADAVRLVSTRVSNLSCKTRMHNLRCLQLFFFYSPRTIKWHKLSVLSPQSKWELDVRNASCYI